MRADARPWSESAAQRADDLRGDPRRAVKSVVVSAGSDAVALCFRLGAPGLLATLLDLVIVAIRCFVFVLRPGGRRKRS